MPVAPKCNIQCNYCNRKFDCCNESRPGVTSTILSPLQSAHYLKALTEKIPNLTVVGIAGPGDPFANPAETISTMKIAKQEFPDMIFCLSTNGLNLAPYIDEIAEIGVSHVTITINSLNPETLAKIYRWVNFEGTIYRGIEGGKKNTRTTIEMYSFVERKRNYCKDKYRRLPGNKRSRGSRFGKRSRHVGS